MNRYEYAAGMLDKCGFIGIRGKGNNHEPAIQVHCKHLDVLVKLQSILRVGKVYDIKINGGNSYTYHVYGRNVKAVLEKLTPYFHHRKKAAELFLQTFDDLFPPEDSREEQRKKREKIAKRLRELHHFRWSRLKAPLAHDELTGRA